MRRLECPTTTASSSRSTSSTSFLRNPLPRQKTLAALLALLDAVLPRVPEAVFVSRFAGAARILSAAVRATTTTTEAASGKGGDNGNNDDASASASSASAARHAVAALATATAAAAPWIVAAADWPGAPAPAFALLLQLSLDARPKVRRAAATGVARTLAGLRRGAAGGASAAAAASRLPASAPYPSACEALLSLARTVLPAPAAAARAAASAPASGATAARSAADAAVRRSVLDCLHCLSLLREVSGLLPAAASAALPPLVAPLFELGSPVLTRAAGDALAALASAEQQQQQQQQHRTSSSSSSLPSASLVSLVRSLASSPGAWSDGRDAVSTSSVCGALDTAMRALRAADAAAAAEELPGAIAALCGPLTSAGSADGARGAAAAALLSVVQGSAAAACCAIIGGGGEKKQKATKQKPLAVRVAAALAGTLSPRSRAGWTPALPAAAAFFEAAAAAGAAKESSSSSAASEAAALLLERVGELVAGADDAAERREKEADGNGEQEQEGGSLDFAAPAAAALGRALRSLGPSFVLSVLPLNIIEAIDDEEGKIEPRTWMLPLLRQHASGGSLRFWGDSVLPLARACGDRAGTAAAAGDAQRAMLCRALEAQAWATLPTFACWALDGGDALR